MIMCVGKNSLSLLSSVALFFSLSLPLFLFADADIFDGKKILLADDEMQLAKKEREKRMRERTELEGKAAAVNI